MRSIDLALLDAGRVGAGWALERLYHQLSPVVHGYVRSQGARDPEGMVNEVFVRAFRRLPEFEGDAEAFRSWLFTIAHNLLVDERRFLGRRAREITVETVPDVRCGDAEDDAMDRLASGRMRALLDLVSPDQRDVLLLRFGADLSLEEVARATGRTITAVKALQRRGLDTIRRLHAEIDAEAVSRELVATFTEV